MYPDETGRDVPGRAMSGPTLTQPLPPHRGGRGVERFRPCKQQPLAPPSGDREGEGLAKLSGMYPDETVRDVPGRAMSGPTLTQPLPPHRGGRGVERPAAPRPAKRGEGGTRRAAPGG